MISLNHLKRHPKEVRPVNSLMRGVIFALYRQIILCPKLLEENEVLCDIPVLGSADMTLKVTRTDNFESVVLEGHTAPILSVGLDRRSPPGVTTNKLFSICQQQLQTKFFCSLFRQIFRYISADFFN